MSGPGGSEWGFSLVVPDGWIEIEVDRSAADRRAGFVRAVDGVIERCPELRSAATWMLDVGEGVVSDAGLDLAMMAVLGFEVVHDGLTVVSVVGYRLDGGEPADVELLAMELMAPHPSDLLERQVDIVTLPAGRAVRVHIVNDAPAGAEGGVVVEGVDHFVPVPARTDVLLLSCTTPSVLVGQQLLPLFDEIAATIEFQKLQDGQHGLHS